MKTVGIECAECGHCVDLHKASASDSKSLVDARADIENTIVEWLKEDALEKGLQVNYDNFNVVKFLTN
jgi:hypothetical protein